MKKILITLFLFIMILGCRKKIEKIEKEIYIKSNLKEKHAFRIQVDAPEYIKLANDDKILYLQRKNTLKLNFILTKKTPFRLFKYYVIRGQINFIPLSEDDRSFSIPFTVKIKPWIVTNFWIIEVLAILITLLFVLNTVMFFIKTPVSGKIVYIKPIGFTTYLYPKNVFWHFKRNIYTIGTDSKNNYHIVSKNISKHNLKLVYYKDYIKIHCSVDIFCKEGDIKYIEQTNGNLIPDYELINKESKYSNRGRDFKIDKSKTYIFVANKNIIIKLEV